MGGKEGKAKASKWERKSEKKGKRLPQREPVFTFSLQTDASLIPELGLSSEAMDFLFSVLKLILAKCTVTLYLCSARGCIAATHFIVGNFGI